jgi:DNA helicase-2/ATP-dependent DNA helicase PcrA
LRYIADLHIHSLYSRATSKSSHLHGLAAWAVIKGIDVVGTGDFTHPGWLSHLQENLVEAEPGFFRLKDTRSELFKNVVPESLNPDISKIRFVLTSEISSIYKRGGKVRKVHNLLFSPDFDSVRRINVALSAIGNLEADGRPILGLDSRNLLEILLEKVPEGFLVPAHIWTPWFSLFGSKSGFDSIEECFGDLAEHIFALETGLSSDPDMNRTISALDRYSLISNSDCHSPGKLGREANIFSTDFDFFSMREALQNPVDANGLQRFAATVEFYPEEGKYHCDGHRKCGVCMDPRETREHKAICPECGRPMTVGVLYRVMELADRSVPVYPKYSPAVHSLVPLPELLSELLQVGPSSKKVMKAYVELIQHFGSEFTILLDADVGDLERGSSGLLAEGVKRVRNGKVIRQPGYDGEFGVIRVFTEIERKSFGRQKK